MSVYKCRRCRAVLKSWEESCERCKVKRREAYLKAKAAGICSRCDRPAPGGALCAYHAEIQRERKRSVDSVAVKLRRDRRAHGKCYLCGVNDPLPRRTSCEQCIQRARSQAEERSHAADTRAKCRNCNDRPASGGRPECSSCYRSRVPAVRWLSYEEALSRLDDKGFLIR